ncbi:hypothetical protein BH18VER1_BH18VER1_11830 [soil metagenome]
MSNSLQTPAWQLLGLTRSVPGTLSFRSGRLTFTTAEGKIFDVALSEIGKVHFPWYYFGGGMKLLVAAEEYRLSLVRPNDSDDLAARMEARSEFGGGAALDVVTGKSRDILSGRRAGRAWKSFFQTHELVH